MKALVVGGSGFVGHRLVRHLLVDGHNVRVLDVKRGGLRRLVSSNFRFFLGSMADEEIVRRVMDGVDVVYHLALAGSVGSIKSPDAFDVNLRGTWNLLASAKSQQVRQFIFTSSTAVYGPCRYLPVDEEHPCHPEESRLDMYHLVKLTTEKMCRMFHLHADVSVTVLRLTYVFCDESVYNVPWVNWIVEKVENNETIEVVEGEGFASVHVDEVVDALMLATLNEKAIGQVFNVVNPETFVTYHEIARHHVQRLESKSQIDIKKPSGLVQSTPTSSSKIQKLLGWKPWMSKDDAINP
ncbi:MAG: NAD-dependent epimerase/dehydratase family protein [Thermoproteota archaeon]|nr:NAD-dependent epimerase/dehydratase family protein [Thermoproteota archaeon]